MALQDDIVAMLSQIGTAGDRATSREALGRKLYEEMGDRLSGDVLRTALRDVESARGPMGEMEDYSRVADILEKYMQDATEPLPDTAAAIPRPRPVASSEIIAVEELPAPAPRTPISIEELPLLQRPELDETAMASMAREFGGERQMNQERLQQMGLSSIEGGDVPLRDRLMEGQGEPMSGGEQLALASSLIPVAALPQLARAIGMTATQIARYLRAGKRGEDALRQVIRQRTGAQMMRDPSTGRMIGAKDVGPQPQTPLNRMMSQAESGGVPAGMYAEGGSLRDRILKTYGGM